MKPCSLRFLGTGVILGLVFSANIAGANPPTVPSSEGEAREILTSKFEAQKRSIVQVKMDEISAARKGNPKAPIVIIEFTDFGCSRCQAFYLTTYPLIDSDLIKTGLVLYVSMNFYLGTPCHAKAALAAGNQGKYWEMKDLLFTSDRVPDEQVYADFAQKLKLDQEAFFAAYRSSEIAKEVELEHTQGHEMGVVITPTFMVGWRLPDGMFVGTRISGPKPWTFFRDLVNQMANVQ